jgi:glycerol-3-phosphate dehydrogenase
MMRAAVRLGAVAVNYVRRDALWIVNGRVDALIAIDEETSGASIAGKVVYNAAGVWVDSIRRLADPAAQKLIAVSRGSHIVLDHRFLPGAAGLMIPKTSDGRVLFAIPWLGRLIVGTTDVPAEGPAWEPQPSAAEIEFILETARGYLERPPSASDVSPVSPD